MGKQLRLPLRVLKPLFQNRGDPCMQLPASVLEHRLVGGLLDEGVLEDIRCRGEGAAAKHQLRSDELVEAVSQSIALEGGHRGKEFVGKRAADRGAELGNLLD